MDMGITQDQNNNLSFTISFDADKLNASLNEAKDYLSKSHVSPVDDIPYAPFFSAEKINQAVYKFGVVFDPETGTGETKRFDATDYIWRDAIANTFRYITCNVFDPYLFAPYECWVHKKWRYSPIIGWFDEKWVNGATGEVMIPLIELPKRIHCIVQYMAK